ncbi:Ionic transporter y4hA OS=Streptomyces canus OX=58343 GN=AQJ46_15615 PE=4 SV=1 [Streptomyces canus]
MIIALLVLLPETIAALRSGPLVLGLGSTHMVLLALTVVVSSLTVVPGRATPLQGGVHLVLFAAYLELAVNP